MAEDFLILKPGMSLERSIDSYPGGIVICIDKPLKWTSADAIRKIKFSAIRFFGKRNLKVGHAGTLDPLATGVLLCCIGPATRMAETIQNHDKEYVADVAFGATTASYDREQPIDRTFPTDGVTRESVAAALPGFLGESDQVAPLFSAKNVDGQRAYELARKLFKQGRTLDESAQELLRRNHIRIDEMELLEFAPDGQMSTDLSEYASRVDNAALIRNSTRINQEDNSHLHLPTARVRIACTKGTYVRAIARDLGEALGGGAHLSGLRRTRSGIFKVEDALSLDEITEIFGPERQ